jgi:hypothetical protein
MYIVFPFNHFCVMLFTWHKLQTGYENHRDIKELHLKCLILQVTYLVFLWNGNPEKYNKFACFSYYVNVSLLKTMDIL